MKTALKILAGLNVILLLGWTYTFDTTTPADTESPTLGANRIREGKLALQERLDRDLYFSLISNSATDANCGLHRWVTFAGPNTPSVVASGTSAIYVKDVNGRLELCYMDQNEQGIQLTEGLYTRLRTSDRTLYNNSALLGIKAPDGNGVTTAEIIKLNDANLPQIGDGAVAGGATDANDGSLTLATKGFVDSSITAVSKNSYVMLADIKTSGTAGGTFTKNTWQKRTINTELCDAGDLCTLASDRFTLKAGTYYCRISAPAYRVDRHQIVLHDYTNDTNQTYITGTGHTMYGTQEVTNTSGGYATTRSVISGMFTIAADTAFEVWHYAENTNASDGLGSACSFGTEEIYTTAEFWKVN